MIRLKLYSTTLLLFLGYTVMAQGVQFEDIQWDKVIDKAKNEYKLIFVDVYADWCAPCRKMDAETFPNPEVGAYMNKHFVSFKANYKEPTAKMLSRKHGVSSFPTYLFLDTNGNLIYKARGFMKPEKLMMEAKVASDPGSYNKMKLYRKKFNSGNRDPELLKKYLLLSSNTYKQPNDEVFYAYYKSLDLMDKQNPEILEAIALCMPYAEGGAYDLALNHYMDLKDTDEKKEVIGNRLHFSIDRSIEKHCKKDPGSELSELMEKKAFLLKISNPEDSLNHNKEVDLLELKYYKCGDHWGEYPRIAYVFVDEYLFSDERFHLDSTVDKSLSQVSQDIVDASILAQFADNIEKHGENSDAYELGLDWINKAIDWNDKYEYQGIKAYLLSHTGNMRDAIKVARRALGKARKAKSEYAAELENIMMKIVDAERNKVTNPEK